MPETPVVALVPVQRRIIEWDANGVPILTAQPVLTKAHIQSLYMVVAAQPYEVTDPLDPDFGLFDGMTIAEVLVRKQLLAAVKSGEAELVMDRLIGKALTKSESVTLHATYEEYLKALEAKMRPDKTIFGELA